MTTMLGLTSDGRTLTYDAALYEFALDGEGVAFDDVRRLDVRGWIRWRADELCAWFRHIVPADLEACNRRARASLSRLEYRSSDERVATVDSSGRVRICGAGSADIYAYRVNAAGAGPAARLVTIEAPNRAVPAESATSETAALPDARTLPESAGPNRSARIAEPAEETAPHAAVVPSGSSMPSSVMKSFKGKGGKLAKDKSFSLGSRLVQPVTFRKTDGDEGVDVSGDGTVTVRKGLGKGIYTADVRALPRAGGREDEEAITVTVKVK